MSSESGLNAAPSTAILAPDHGRPSISAVSSTTRVRRRWLIASTSRRKVRAPPAPSSPARAMKPRMSFGRQPPPNPSPALRNEPADPRVVPERLGQHGDVTAARLADLRHRVDEGDLGGEEGVGGHLGELGRGEVGVTTTAAGGDRSAWSSIVSRAASATRRVGQAEDDPRGRQGVLDRVALAQELRAPHQHGLPRARGEVRDPGGDPLGGADRDRRLADDQGRPLEQRRQALHRRVEVGDVRGELALALRGRDADEVDVAEVRDLLERRGEAQPPRLDVLAQHRLEARLVERQPGLLQRRHPGLVDVDAEHVVPELRHARSMGRPQVSAPDDRDPSLMARSPSVVRLPTTVASGDGGPPPPTARERLRRLTDAPPRHRGSAGGARGARGEVV